MMRIIFTKVCQKKTSNDECNNIIKNNAKRFERSIKKLLSLPDVVQITVYHSEGGLVNSEDEYELVEWNIDEFASEFFKAMSKNMMFQPTIKVVFTNI